MSTTPNAMHVSPAKIVLSPPPKFLSPARPFLQQTRCCESVCVCRQLADYSLSAAQDFLTFYYVSANKAQIYGGLKMT